jgi:hypothetical protein
MFTFKYEVLEDKVLQLHFQISDKIYYVTLSDKLEVLYTTFQSEQRKELRNDFYGVWINEGFKNQEEPTFQAFKKIDSNEVFCDVRCLHEEGKPCFSISIKV